MHMCDSTPRRVYIYVCVCVCLCVCGCVCVCLCVFACMHVCVCLFLLTSRLPTPKPANKSSRHCIIISTTGLVARGRGATICLSKHFESFRHDLAAKNRRQKRLGFEKSPESLGWWRGRGGSSILFFWFLFWVLFVRVWFKATYMLCLCNCLQVVFVWLLCLFVVLVAFAFCICVLVHDAFDDILNESCETLIQTAKPILLQHTGTLSNSLQHTATHCNTLQHIATHCNTLVQTAKTSPKMTIEERGALMQQTHTNAHAHTYKHTFAHMKH